MRYHISLLILGLVGVMASILVGSITPTNTSAVLTSIVLEPNSTTRMLWDMAFTVTFCGSLAVMLINTMTIALLVDTLDRDSRPE
jgi:hypothetical protein